MRLLEITDLTASDVKAMFAELNTNITNLRNEVAQQPKAKDEPENMTIDDVCTFLRIKRVCVWKWTRDGKLVAYRIGGKKYYKRSEVETVLTNSKTV